MNFDKMVYSCSAAARILHCEPSDINRLEVWAHVVFVIQVGHRPTFLSKKLFKAEFAQSRQQSARSLQVHKSLIHSGQYIVTNPKSSKSDQGISRYVVTAYPDHFECQCRDYQAQTQAGIKQATCKHAYGVIQYLGLNTLKDWIQKQKQLDPFLIH